MSHYFIGTNDRDDGNGIYHVSIDNQRFSDPRLLQALNKPSWLDLDRQRGQLYAAETFKNKNGKGVLHSFAVQDDYSLKAISSVETAGAHSCYIAHYQDLVFAADYGGGTLSVCRRNHAGELELLQSFQHEGSSVNEKRQDRAHAHQVLLSPDNKWVLSCDLGSDRIYIYQLKDDGLSQAGHYQVKTAGSGPRHLVFHPNEPLVYVLHELAGTMDVLRWDSSAGKLAHVQQLDLPGDQASDLRWCGRFLYAGLRSNNSIAIIDTHHAEAPQFIEATSVGGRPRGFAISDDQTQLLVGNEREDQLELFSRDQKTGLIGERLHAVALPAPVCVCSLQHAHRQAVYGT